MINAIFYKYINIAFITLLTFLVSNKYRIAGSNSVHEIRQNSYIATFLMLIFTFFIGTRPESFEFVDMMWYAKYLHSGMMMDYGFDVENIIFDNILALWVNMKFSAESFYIFIAFIYYGGILFACKKLFPNNTLLAFVVYLGAFSTFSYAVNGVKAGAAASIFLIALAYRDNWKKCLPLLFVSWGFHHAMMMPIAAFIVVKFYKNPKVFFLGWLFCFIMAAAHVTYFQVLFANYTDDKSAEYLATTGEDWKGQAGFRIDFILYSVMPILVGWYAVMKHKIKSEFYNELLCLYLLCNGLWMLTMYVNYNNRIAYLSWLMYPIVLIYPFLNENWPGNKNKILVRVAILHVMFTLFMNIFYYA